MQTRVVVLPPPPVPSALLLPTPGPFRPGPGATQKDAALAVADLSAALAACNADKDAVARILAEYANGVTPRED